MGARRPSTTATGLSAPGSIANALLQIATKPDRQSQQYAAWIEQQDLLEFLRAGRQREDVVLVLYAGPTHYFLYGIVVSSLAVTAVGVGGLPDRSGNPFSTWGLCHGYREGPSEGEIGSSRPESPEMPPRSSDVTRVLYIRRRSDGLLGVRLFVGQEAREIQAARWGFGASQAGRAVQPNRNDNVDDSAVDKLMGRLARITYIGPFRSAINDGSGTYFDLSIGRAVFSVWRFWKTDPLRACSDS